jgi:DNA-binding NarL/FixJ family response regulator
MEQKILKIIESDREKTAESGENVELSDREKDILIAVAKGMMNKEIADKFNISIHTVITHRKNIMRKTGIKTISGLTLYALFNNIASQEDLQ